MIELLVKCRKDIASLESATMKGVFHWAFSTAGRLMQINREKNTCNTDSLHHTLSAVLVHLSAVRVTAQGRGKMLVVTVYSALYCIRDASDSMAE